MQVRRRGSGRPSPCGSRCGTPLRACPVSARGSCARPSGRRPTPVRAMDEGVARAGGAPLGRSEPCAIAAEFAASAIRHARAMAAGPGSSSCFSLDQALSAGRQHPKRRGRSIARRNRRRCLCVGLPHGRRGLRLQEGRHPPFLFGEVVRPAPVGQHLDARQQRRKLGAGRGGVRGVRSPASAMIGSGSPRRSSVDAEHDSWSHMLRPNPARASSTNSGRAARISRSSWRACPGRSLGCSESARSDFAAPRQLPAPRGLRRLQAEAAADAPAQHWKRSTQWSISARWSAA